MSLSWAALASHVVHAQSCEFVFQLVHSLITYKIACPPAPQLRNVWLRDLFCRDSFVVGGFGLSHGPCAKLTTTMKQHKNLSTSRRVKGSFCRDSLSTEKSVTLLLNIHLNRVREEQRQAEQTSAACQLRERIIEAAMEIGDFTDDFPYPEHGDQQDNQEPTDEEVDADEMELVGTERMFSTYFLTAT
ncbi:hypothetical protein JVT61DRAFT_4275 [Boletus reticuloceps]|uniref:Uncharacterized protein n=1 Tax=Boletus reticuloceps TaxID=495285 RepID=A0A8I3A756_9AGAM|nr:hypothetical protein JVT61DRAFT_4275 [Boletus reticuloceps]